MLPTYGGYSGEPIRPIALASVASVAQSVDIPVCGIGGIVNYEHVLEYIMLGASAVQIGTALILNGDSIIKTIVNDLKKWFKEKEINSISEICGQALGKIKPLDELALEPMTCKSDNKKCKDSCNLCVEHCLENAIEIVNDNDIKIDQEKCIGCGLCIFVCPINKLKIYYES